MADTVSKVNDGGSAFPQYSRVGEVEQGVGGMSLRDWYAGMALQGLVRAEGDTVAHLQEFVADSWRLADMMIAARDGG